MKIDAINTILTCPSCAGFPLELKIDEEKDASVVKGSLICPACKSRYQIVDGIPCMIPEVMNSASLNQNNIELHTKIRDANRTYHDAIGNLYERDSCVAVHQSEENQKRLGGIIRDLSRKSSGRYLLDVGCGTGNILKFGAEHYKYAVGVDVSIELLKVARDRGLEVVQADAMLLPFRPMTFDTVGLFSVLHHIYDYQRFIINVYGIIAAEGYLYTDWDLQKTPELDTFALKLTNSAFIKIEQLIGLLLNKGTEKTDSKRKLFQKSPELLDVYKTAEYYAESEDRGLEALKIYQAPFFP